jgi:hypothetical protein
VFLSTALDKNGASRAARALFEGLRQVTRARGLGNLPGMSVAAEIHPGDQK